MGFVRKVYSILSVQLLLTAVIAYPVMQLGRQWLMHNMGIFYAVMALQVVCLIAITCYKGLRTFPQNYIFLFVFTATEGVLVGIICTGYTGPSVAVAALMTTLIFFMLTAFAWTTKSDFTGAGPYLMAALFTLLSVTIVMFILQASGAPPAVVNPLSTMYAGCGALLFSFFIVHDTQLMIGGRHKVQFSIDDYCFAALNLYLDVINLFLLLLEMFGQKK